MATALAGGTTAEVAARLGLEASSVRVSVMRWFLMAGTSELVLPFGGRGSCTWRDLQGPAPGASPR
jgi:hypothetical protein